MPTLVDLLTWASRVPFVDPRTGILTPHALRVLAQQFFDRMGGVEAMSNTELEEEISQTGMLAMPAPRPLPFPDLLPMPTRPESLPHDTFALPERPDASWPDTFPLPGLRQPGGDPAWPLPARPAVGLDAWPAPPGRPWPVSDDALWFGAIPGALRGVANLSTVGVHSFWLPAGALRASVTAGATFTTIEMASNKNTYDVFSFADGASKSYVEFSVAFPGAWNEGTITFQPFWTVNSTNTGGVVWGLEGQALSDGDALDAAYGTAQEVVDNGLGTAYLASVGSESAAITLAGTPAPNDLCHFRFYRDPANASDTLPASVLLLGLKVFYTTDSGVDT